MDQYTTSFMDQYTTFFFIPQDLNCHNKKLHLFPPFSGPIYHLCVTCSLQVSDGVISTSKIGNVILERTQSFVKILVLVSNNFSCHFMYFSIIYLFTKDVLSFVKKK